ncbi:MAG TPA: CDP-alcohol phosphatidyltransferase family protein [Candidatus Thermoplasmatota archaeon]|nr:CDP-alcohol phosphatidyltransferase family protein [Candidatus Thermoplasmatota archaeon]
MTKPIPPVSELKKICWKSQDAWLSWKLYRTPSIYVTWLLGHTPITANGVTLLGVLFAMAAWAMLATGDLAWMLGGALLLQVWVLLDHTDGEIARLRRYRGLPGSASVEGAFAEYVGNHLVVHPITIVFVGVGAYHHWGEIAYLYMGFAGAFASLLAMAIWLRRHMLLLKFVYLDPDHEAGYMGQTPESHLRERGLSPATDPAAAAAPAKTRRSLRDLIGDFLLLTSNFIEFSLLVIAAVAIDFALAAAGYPSLAPQWFLHGALTLFLLYYGVVFPLATVASIFTNIRFQIAHDLAGYVAHAAAKRARAQGKDAPAVPNPAEDH